MHIPDWLFVVLIMLFSTGALFIKNRNIKIYLGTMLVAVLIAGIFGVLG